MPKIASWVREPDEPRFQRFFDAHAGMELRNARTETFDPADCDGVMITGGPDISSGFLSQPVPDPALIEDAQPERDEWEFSALRKALDCGVPVLAICKGHQVFNVALGGTLLLDLIW
jgi:putative glutamine amidotransferase